MKGKVLGLAQEKGLHCAQVSPGLEENATAFFSENLSHEIQRLLVAENVLGLTTYGPDVS
jgi:hypothetical protein